MLKPTLTNATMSGYIQPILDKSRKTKDYTFKRPGLQNLSWLRLLECYVSTLKIALKAYVTFPLRNTSPLTRNVQRTTSLSLGAQESFNRKIINSMVGVAGKSKGCNTCRKRRVKCDLGRPFCQKCIISHRSCAGYGRDLVFVNRTPSSTSSTAVSVLSELRAQRQLEDILLNPKIEAALHQSYSEALYHCSRFREFAVGILRATYFPKPYRTQDVDISEGSFSWVYSLLDLLEPSKSLDTALFAFCLAQLHVTGTGDVGLYRCLEQHTAALKHLYSDLDDPIIRSREETLAAIIVLSTFELFVRPGGNGYSVHARGIAEILRLRGPRMASTPTWRRLFSRLRIVCTLEALTKRQVHCIENDIWRQIVPESSDALDELYQMISDVPAALERATSLPSIVNEDVLFEESKAVSQSIFTMLKSFEKWHHDFWKASPTPRAWSVPSHAVNPADVDPSNRIFPFCFEFESLNVSVLVSQCWGISVHLISNIIQIYELVQRRSGHPVELEDLLLETSIAVVDEAKQCPSQTIRTLDARKGRLLHQMKSEGTKLARHLCQSMEYHHRVDMGTYGGHAVTYSSWSARQYFRLHPGHEREWAWLQNMHKMEGPGTRWGLSNMIFEDIPEPLGGLSQ